MAVGFEILDEALQAGVRDDPVGLRVWCELGSLHLHDIELLVKRRVHRVKSLLLILLQISNIEGLRVENLILIPAIVQFKGQIDQARLDWVIDKSWINSREEQNRCKNEQYDAECEAEANEELLRPVSLLKLAPLLALVTLILVEVDVVERVIEAEPLEQV